MFIKNRALNVLTELLQYDIINTDVYKSLISAVSLEDHTDLRSIKLLSYLKKYCDKRNYNIIT